MLFLVISSPNVSRPDEIKTERLQFRSWIKDLKSNNSVQIFYPLASRGSVAIFNVSSNEELHVFLTQWANIVPSSFEIRVLINPEVAETLLA